MLGSAVNLCRRQEALVHKPFPRPLESISTVHDDDDASQFWSNPVGCSQASALAATLLDKVHLPHAVQPNAPQSHHTLTQHQSASGHPGDAALEAVTPRRTSLPFGLRHALDLIISHGILNAEQAMC